MFNFLENKIKDKKAFALLYAVLISGVVLAIGLTLSNIISKQIILSSIGKESQVSYYLADGARDCLKYWDAMSTFGYIKKGIYYPPSSSVRIDCGGGQISPDSSIVGLVPSFIGFGSGSYARTYGFFLSNYSDRCVRVAIGKKGTSAKTAIISFSSNMDCSASSPRRVERIVQDKY